MPDKTHQHPLCTPRSTTAFAFGAFVFGVGASLMPSIYITICCWIVVLSMICLFYKSNFHKPDFWIVLVLFLMAFSVPCYLSWQYIFPPYIFFTPNQSSLNNLMNKIPLWQEATGDFHNVHWWIYPRPAKPAPNDMDRDWKNWNSMRMYNTGVTIPHVRKQSPELVGIQLEPKPGDYIIDIATDEGTFSESLKILKYKEKLVWFFDVTKNGKLLYSSPRPKGFIE